ncbi:MAG: hypothetical protein LBU32_06225 [Clostridiales bacterium]|nr:hypothetical protein [Clostridiales bacterium]
MDCAVYFRHPHSSLKKGANERHNGLLRRFAEKGRSAGGMPAPLHTNAADWNNNLPRKILGCRTPAEMFEEELLKIAKGAVRRLRLHATPAPASSVSLWRGKASLWHLLHLPLQLIHAKQLINVLKVVGLDAHHIFGRALIIHKKIMEEYCVMYDFKRVFR